MTQIVWIPAQNASTTVRGILPTTGVHTAQILPAWAPQIAHLPTTTSAMYNAIIEQISATSSLGLSAGAARALHVRGWRIHGGRQYVTFDGETTTITKVTLTYRSLGELVRT